MPSKAAERDEENESAEELSAKDHAKQLGLSLGHDYVIRGSSVTQTYEGKLISTSDLGLVIQSHGQSGHSFIPWHNVFVVTRA